MIVMIIGITMMTGNSPLQSCRGRIKVYCCTYSLVHFFCDLVDISDFIYCFERPLLYRVMMRSCACPPIFHNLPPLWDKFVIGLKFETCHRIIISIKFRNDAPFPSFLRWDGWEGEWDS